MEDILEDILYAIDYTLGNTPKEMNPDESERLLREAGVLLNKMIEEVKQDHKFQIVYKSAVFTDGISTYKEALEIFEHYAKHDKIEEKYLSIEVEIGRDKKRHDGHPDTRATIEEISEDFITKEYSKAMNTIDEMKKLLEVHK